MLCDTIALAVSRPCLLAKVDKCTRATERSHIAPAFAPKIEAGERADVPKKKLKGISKFNEIWPLEGAMYITLW